eukprot:CAMPEP_0172490144 /NCGR_PEP_ID=MMETSP1066-20121228/20475_1 /TAXON_ID=671091 /ORGANISM="Coscinodiscus wailesii, Strain CCMP2513" /LENGTH=333 /DNA_ID=CAMNT_0013258461 /DNA_START=79 /DNA_END=1080 /DNA_ORIENTATION=-
MSNISLLLYLLLQLLSLHHLLPTIRAHSNYAGSCNAGGGISSTHFGDTTGSLSSAGYHVLIDNRTLVDGSDTTSPRFNVTIGNEAMSSFIVTVRTAPSSRSGGDDSDDSFFRGFLIRVSDVTTTGSRGGYGDVYHSLSVIDDGTDTVQDISNVLCQNGVAGVCHRNNQAKTEISVMLSLDNAALERMMATTPNVVVSLLVEVTVVRENRGSSNDGWFYTGFEVSFVVARPSLEDFSEAPSGTVPSSTPGRSLDGLSESPSGTMASSAPSRAPVLGSSIPSFYPTGKQRVRCLNDTGCNVADILDASGTSFNRSLISSFLSTIAIANMVFVFWI